MKDWFQGIWKDPVWSKVIAAAIIAAAGAVFSLVKSWLNESETLEESFRTVFSYHVNIWLAIAVVMALLIIVGAIKKIRANKEHVPIPPFVNGFTMGIYQGQRWQWRWQWSKTYEFYYIADLNVVCPACHEGLLTVTYMDYKCGKCGADIPYNMINANTEAAEKQILEDARKQYDYCAEYIGKLPSGFVRA